MYTLSVKNSKIAQQRQCIETHTHKKNLSIFKLIVK